MRGTIPLMNTNTDIIVLFSFLIKVTDISETGTSPGHDWVGRFACEYDANSDCMWKKPSQITGYNNSLFKFLEI